ncbi:MAG TPA: hypothetical protein VIS29_14205 [Streptomyces sp.]
MSNRRATVDQVDELHALQAATLFAEVKRYTDRVDPETGKPAPEPVPPALLAQINKFLKDNGVDSPVRAGTLKDSLKDRLPDLEDVEAAHQTLN